MTVKMYTTGGRMSPSFTWLSISLCVVAVFMVLTSNSFAAQAAPTDADARAAAFIADHESRVRPLEIAVGTAWWKANTTGKDEDFAAKEEAQNRLDQALSDAKRFAELKSLHDSKLADPLVARQIAVLYLSISKSRFRRSCLRQDHRQVQRHRKGVQRLPRQGRRPRDDRQRGPQGAFRLEGFRRAEDGVGGEQGRRAGCRGRPQGARAAAQRSGHGTWASRTTT